MRPIGIVLAALAVAAPAMAADWVTTGLGGRGERYEIDLDTLQRRGDLVQSYMRVTLRRAERDPATGKLYASALITRYDDCAARRFEHGRTVQQDRLGKTVNSGESGSGWSPVLPGSVGEGAFNLVCAATSPPQEKAFVDDIREGRWDEIGLSENQRFRLSMLADGMVRMDKDHVIVLSRSDYVVDHRIEGLPVRHTVTANVVDCTNLRWDTLGTDFYASPKIRLMAFRKREGEFNPETIRPGSMLFGSLRAICAPGAALEVAESGPSAGVGSGTAWGVQKGYLVTASHVITGADAISVFADGERIGSAKVVANDPANDLAVLKFLPEGAVKLPVLALSDRAAALGRSVFTLGYPEPGVLGQNVKMTAGEVSSTSGLQDDARYLQISVPLQSGNSGGPLIGWDGGVVGVVQAKLILFGEEEEGGPPPENVNFAVKASYLRPLLEDLPDLGNYVLVRAAGSADQVVAATRTAVFMLVVEREEAASAAR